MHRYLAACLKEQKDACAGLASDLASTSRTLHAKCGAAEEGLALKEHEAQALRNELATQKSLMQSQHAHELAALREARTRQSIR